MSGGVHPASRWSPADYAACAGFVPRLGLPLVDRLAPRPGERVLDVGCGDGVLSAALVAAGAVVTGVDGSAEMVAAARARGIDARVGDAQAMDFGPEFDAAFSNAALHWMPDAGGVARGVFAALRPGGRFVGEMGGAGNVATIWAAVRAELVARGRPPTGETHWYPSVAAFTAIYAGAGFTAIEAELVPRPTPLPSGVTGWIRTFRAGLLDPAIPEPEQEAIAAGAERRCEGLLRDPDGGWTADYVRLRFSMRKPA